MENKTDEEDEVEFEFPFSMAWYAWAALIVAGIIYAVLVFPFTWTKDKLVSLKNKCELAMAFHRCNDF